MKKTIPFEVFAPNETIYFDVLRLAALEAALGASIVDVVRKGDSGIGFCLTGLMIGMKHHYFKATREFYAEKIEAHFENGGSLDDIAIPIVRAIMASGVFGKSVTDKVEAEIAEKNV